MLKALELAGFKSFADRTRFEFPRGISVVVGPNGSGKSNLVDAVKWVLGSQSAKSLRGKEMVDVIFNGCASRAPLGTGEATLTLDNEDGRLPIDAKEVHVTRRVYRSGEGEYLLNRQPCRLRDIREVLAGTGITTEAYCIIEQGKVDALLQSSPRDRRIIFEEAAGISQFKAKKASAMRRLERVEQNLLRLSDIVDEVESRLRSVRSQAGKARRYRECTERLQQLRTHVGLVDWRALTKQIAAREAQLAELRRRSDERSAALERAEADCRRLEQQLEAGLQRLREIEAAASATREQIAARQATVENQRTRQLDLQQELDRIRRQLANLSTRAGTAVDHYREATEQLRTADAELAAAALARQELKQRADQSQSDLDEARSELEQVRSELAEAKRTIAVLDDQRAALAKQLTSVRSTIGPARQQLADLARQREIQTRELAQQGQAEAALAAQAQSHQTALRTSEQRLAQVRGELARVDKQHRAVEARLTRTRERIQVLSELEHRLEGLDGGVQEVLRQARDEPEGPLGDVLGVVADLFHVDVDSAPLLEVALGERAQYVVVASAGRLLGSLQDAPLGVAGRVGFLPLDSRAAAAALDHVELSTESGVMGRADRFVETTVECVPLVQRLLGRTWLVDRLATALRLSQTTGRGLEFVTSDGELLASDGTLVVGPRMAAAGIMSRRSELRACHEQVGELEQHLAQHAALHSRLEQERARQEALVASSVSAYTDLAGKLADLSQQTAAVRARLDRIAHQHQQTETELGLAEQRVAELSSELHVAESRREDTLAALDRLQVQVAAGVEKLSRLQQRHVQVQASLTERQVAAAKCEQRVEMFRHQMELAQRNQQERDRSLADTREGLAARQTRLAELDEAMLADRQALAELFVQKERHVEVLAHQAKADDALRSRRAESTEQVRSERQQLSAVQAQLNKLEVVTSRLRHERQTLCERMQDDYGIDLAKEAGSDPEGTRQEAGSTEHGVGSEEHGAGNHSGLPAPCSLPPAPGARSAVDREIAQLRDQINNIGAVNLDALDELEHLESRFGTLSAQYRDLVDAKGTLERIVHRINADSRQLFVTTLEIVRGHFQELFRRLFGGGEADIIIDDAEDVLESGIEIVARPPGKEACSISLLSGGEKTLTCVALLLAVFRSKPSPFCVLDEVDAALDEANIGRFIGVLREFLSFTQFVVVTHSKKTMTGADTLYGVTMEESGVSKRVSVRFEDVSEDGQILPTVLRRAA